ncbi:MoaF C-terminal domain-containing protein [Flavobacterium sp. NG2]|uniref:MoaF-related domain-containing protein n=1 Tax=Flavobacterium sp. NG2 TaxID=3097547 RepID=UPI002A81CE75|nr:MoaF C-terminal domain-containing protein [Flavobacterium sp. NG2]WPR71305.1 MoaF C-terminal domain-containing protein [Flavobacterium sp. NG2]
MKKALITFISIITFSLGFSQTKTTDTNKFEFGEAEHLLDGYSLNFQYQDGKAIHMEFYNGKAKYEWIVGPGKGNGNQDIPYRSHQIAENIYIVNWHETGIKDYLTIVFDFERMVVHSSIIVGYENKPERTLKTVFQRGIIDHLKK